MQHSPGGGGSPGGTYQPPIAWQDRDNTYNGVAPAYSYDSGWNYENLSMRDDVDGVEFSNLPIGDDNAYGVSQKPPKEFASYDPEANSTPTKWQEFKGVFGKAFDGLMQLFGWSKGHASEGPSSLSVDSSTPSSHGSEGTGPSGEPSSSEDGSPEGTGKTVDDILKDAQPGRATKGPTT